MHDNNKRAFGNIYSMSLRSKILLGFLFSVIPMLVIVAITYFPAKNSTIESSHRQIALISGNGAEHADHYFESAAATFHAWTEEDVYGMAMEFDAIDELEKHFTTMQADNPDFQLLLVADNDGIIKGEGRSGTHEVESLTGTIVKDASVFHKSPGTEVLLVPRSPLENAADIAPKFLYRYRTEDSDGQANGYLLAYLETGALQAVADSIRNELVKSGFPSSRVEVLNVPDNSTVVFAGVPLPEEELQFQQSSQAVIAKSVAGEIGLHRSGKRSEHIVYFPLSISATFRDAGYSRGTAPDLCLFVTVDDNEIMAGVRKTLLLTCLVGGFGLLATIVLGYFTVRTITTPISNLVSVLQRYSEGDAEVRAVVKSHDEIGFFTSEFNAMLEEINTSGKALQESEARFRNLFEGLQDAVSSKNYAFRFSPQSRDDDLALSLNKMLQTLEDASNRAQEDDWLKTGLTILSEKISGEHDLSSLCNNAITFIANYTKAQIGTLFVKSTNDDLDDGGYELIASFAYRSRKGLANRYKDGEGLVGQAALEKKVILFTDVPDDYVQIESSLGQSVPDNIIVIPLLYEGTVQGIIELGATFAFDRRLMNFAEQVGNVVGVAINGAVASDRLKGLLEQTKKQSEILTEQQEELQKANQELEEQTETLRESEARLQLQQEELQTSNEEMEEKNQLLEEQKKENEEKNRNLQEKQREIEEKAQQLELATKYKSEFLSNMSHELRTPLNSILLLAKMLADNDEKNLSEDQIESAASIHRGGQTLLHLINDILDLSKIEAGRVELNISAIRPATIKADFEMEFNHLAKQKGLEFTTIIGEGLPDTIITDVYRMEQIIRNLLGNAFKFTDQGSVTLRVDRPDAGDRIGRTELTVDNTIRISVIDTGPGIPEDKRVHIFEAFRQVDGSISRRHGGTGLGLSISRELANLLGGEISVESELGNGATFTLYIPQILAAGQGSQRAADIKPPPPAPRLPRVQETVPEPAEPPGGETGESAIEQVDSSVKRMLIIEDDPDFASILSDFFKKNGYDSIIAPTGEKGVKYAIEYTPTAIILDIGLPGIDGWTVLSELKNNPDTRHIPVHIMSAFDDSCEGLKKGAVGYLTKPVSMDGLRSALGKIEHVLDNEVKELLVVEDDRELRNNILKLMSTNDIRATTAETGKEAMEMLRTNRFDCMILDLGLPDISGFTLLDEIEYDSSINRLPVIIYTGRDLTIDETERLQKYSSSIVLKNALSMERLLDETALFMHRVEQEMPESHKKIIQDLREKDSSIRGKRVLLVDDDMRNAFALSKFLKSKGVEISIADNGQKALDLLESEPLPDIILMDIMMPVMDGYEAMKRIRKKPELKNLPILALTAKAMDTDREECLRCGANDYLSKPIDTKKLLSMLRIWMY